MDLVSIIITCYNDKEYIEQSIKSAFNQTYANTEIIVVDDGSDLPTKNLLKKLRSYYDVIIYQKNLGTSSARNAGIHAASGKYIINLDGDDHLEPQFCEDGLKTFGQSETIKIVTSYAQRFSSNGPVDVVKPRTTQISDLLTYNGIISSMFLKENWRKIGGYDEKMKGGFEDWEFYIRMLKNGGHSQVIPKILYNYRLRKGSRTTKANAIKYTLLKYIYLKHQDLYTENFEILINHLLSRLEREENEKNKNLERPDYKLGNLLLKPFRYIKSNF